MGQWNLYAGAGRPLPFEPGKRIMAKSRYRASLTTEEFVAAITNQPAPAASAAFAAAILGEDHRLSGAEFAAAILGEDRSGRSGRRAARVPILELLDVIPFSRSGAWQTDMLREAGFNPDEPRDERGRWTKGGASGSQPGAGLFSVANSPGSAEQKSPSEASPRARELERILPSILDKLKAAAKHTKEVERFGVILKSKDPKAKQPYKSYECVTKKSWEMVPGPSGQEPRGATESPFGWFGSEKMHGGLIQKPGPDGKTDLDAKGKADPNERIEFDWHTHPHDGDPWPSGDDGRRSKENDVPGVMLRYFGSDLDGKSGDRWAIWIIDNDGKTYEYKPKTPAQK
jgi:hypothetical protein